MTSLVVAALPFCGICPFVASFSLCAASSAFVHCCVCLATLSSSRVLLFRSTEFCFKLLSDVSFFCRELGACRESRCHNYATSAVTFLQRVD
ncbi:hypothetical protein DFP72DRAFT_115307 [Ephemerocybe angulata]|uniref:Uncharacterized protein n=1 Tax=Ephemerocybe angulata TaxID=980116 RepID=A0A8H6M992_9AGAR|nr:hypothetical protein DFP72DRAFT_115307 [Tulosesus angulatus]